MRRHRRRVRPCSRRRAGGHCRGRLARPRSSCGRVHRHRIVDRDRRKQRADGPTARGPAPPTAPPSAAAATARPAPAVTAATTAPQAQPVHATRRPAVHSAPDGMSAPGSGASAACLHALDEGDDQALLELGPGGIAEPGERLAQVERLAVGPGRRHRREGVRDGQDAGDQRDRPRPRAGRGSRRRPSARGGGGCRRGPGRGPAGRARSCRRARRAA